jgi:hypothetical protein
VDGRIGRSRRRLVVQEQRVGQGGCWAFLGLRRDCMRMSSAEILRFAQDDNKCFAIDGV